MSFATQHRWLAMVRHEPIVSPYWIAAIQAAIFCSLVYNSIRLLLQLFHHSRRTTPSEIRLVGALPPSQRPSGPGDSQGDDESSPNAGTQSQVTSGLALRMLRLLDARLAIVMVFKIDLAAASPVIRRTALSTIADIVSNPDVSGLEQALDQHSWVTMVCFIMVLAGFAWATWAYLRDPETRWCRHALQLFGLLSLAVSSAWTAIIYTVDTEDARRFLALSCYLMLITSFLSEAYQYVPRPRQYAITVVPTFLLALHSTLFLVNKQIGLDEAQVWDLRRFYEHGPLPFSLWAILLYWIHKQTLVGPPIGRGSGNSDNGNQSESGQQGESSYRMIYRSAAGASAAGASAAGVPAADGSGGHDSGSGDLPASE